MLIGTNPKPLQGLKQWDFSSWLMLDTWHRNQPQTLTGIETLPNWMTLHARLGSEPTPNPYRDWNVFDNAIAIFDFKSEPTPNPYRDWNNQTATELLKLSHIGTNPKPLQGLKHGTQQIGSGTGLIGTNPKPLQGLKHLWISRWAMLVYRNGVKWAIEQKLTLRIRWLNFQHPAHHERCSEAIEQTTIFDTSARSILALRRGIVHLV